MALALSKSESQFTSRFERLELKFLVDEFVVDQIRREIAPYCRADAHCGAKAGYAISSLYLDTPGLAFHAAKERGDPDRIKLRIRTYSPVSPATFEIKRRRSNVIDKTRAVVSRERVVDAALGRGPANAKTTPDDEQRGVLADFSHVIATSGAGPMLHIRYDREAWESLVDHYARVTFDRAIAAAPAPRSAGANDDEWMLVPDDDAWCPFDDHWGTRLPSTPVVMEIKCTSNIPQWVTELVRRNQLALSSFSKYSVGIHVSGWRSGQARIRSRSTKALA